MKKSMIKKVSFGVLFLAIAVISVFFVAGIRKSEAPILPATSSDETALSTEAPHTGLSVDAGENLFAPPLEHAAERVTKKPFGILINPKTSPVQPERFFGYHTGTDFETFPEEVLAEVSVQAICDGTLIVKRMASGYGGVAVESCLLENNPVTVVYGHLDLTSITAKVGDTIKKGQILGNLGEGYSSETDGERKHLHLGIHKGASINIAGYVSKKSALIDFVDPCLYVCGR